MQQASNSVAANRVPAFRQDEPCRLSCCGAARAGCDGSYRRNGQHL